MHTENNGSTQGVEGMMDSGEDTKEESLRWLLEMDLSEPEEKLFTISEEEYRDEGLSDFEAEVAGRPLTRGNASSDDLASYIDEEIVISSESVRSDIYADSSVEPVREAAETGAGETMAIDFSRRSNHAPLSASLVDDGSDILGLGIDDDMGEKFLSIKRVKAAVGSAQPAEDGAVITAAEAEVEAVQPVESTVLAADDLPDPQLSATVSAGDADSGDSFTLADQASALGEVAGFGSLDGDDDLEWPAMDRAFQQWLSRGNFDSNGVQKIALSNLTRSVRAEPIQE